MCQEISTGSLGPGDMFGLTMGFTFILEYPFVFLNWWKKMNGYKYTFLILNAGVFFDWGKLINQCYQGPVE